MRRAIAALVSGAVLTAAAPASGLHVHASAGHARPDHHHGPAGHHHAIAIAARGHGLASLDSDEPGRGAVPVAWIDGASPRFPATPATLVARWHAVPAVASRVAAPVADPRVHGPPRASAASPRAPPRQFPA